MFSASKTAGPSGYNISRSVRLRSSASAYLNRTLGAPTNNLKWTWSGWVKRGAIGSAFVLFDASVYTVYYSQLGINSSDQFYFFSGDGAAPDTDVRSSNVLRDPSAWYHLMFVFDSANANSANRNILYINGVQVTSFAYNTPSVLNETTYLNSNRAHYIGRRVSVGDNQFDGYLTEVNFIDGQALTPSSFGSTNATTGVWQPAKYTGTYGNNGFYLNFSDNSAATAAAIGKDYSGNGNNWTPNNISVTAGATYDSMIDVPTPYSDGSTNRGNYCVLNPLSYDTGTYTISNANLTFSGARTATATAYVRSTIGVSSGKWYWEVVPTDVGGGPNIIVGVQDSSTTATTAGANLLLNGYGYGADGYKNNNAGQTAGYGATWTNGDVIGIALDLDGGTITFYKNNVSQGVAYSGISGTYCPVISMSTGGVARTIAGSINFGQRPFTYTPPSGFKALNTYNLPASTITNGGKYMAATLYTGTLLSNSITNAGGFKPDLVWVKSRSAATDHKLTDSVRGVTKALISDTTGAETTDTQGLTAFNSNGFTVGTDTNYNNLSATYVGWQWQAGQGSTSSNTSGTITSTVSVNATAGFSIVTYTGTGANATVGHGLGVAPKMVITKSRSNAYEWDVYHIGLTSAAYYIVLNSTAAQALAANQWNSTAPTSTVFSLGSGASGNTSGGSMVAYCWSEIAGFSKFGSYTGNGSTDGPFVYCGFRPRWILLKDSTTAGQNWFIFDTARDTYNQMSDYLLPNTSNAELAFGSGGIDVTANGFKIRTTSTAVNTSGSTLIFAAFAEVPFSAALAR